MPNHLSAKQKAELFIALNFLKMEELAEICKPRKIPTNGKKGAVIERVKHFINTGKILKTPPIPAASRAQANAPSLLKEDALILNGLYKNDDKTRAYLKKLVGDHFHFTAFGQDWIKEQWLHGTPPTYKEFANFWQKEYLRRQSKEYKANPKAEWAYLNFVQKYSATHPGTEKDKVAAAWEKERSAKVEFVFSLLELKS